MEGILSRLSEMDLEKGSLDDTPISLLLGAAKVWEITGVITLERDKTHKKIFFLQGLPVYCRSDLSGESLRQVIYKAGKIDHQTLTKIQEIMDQDNLEEDRVMLKLGIFDESTRYFHLQEQTRKRILSLFGWANGSYSFEPTEDFIDDIDLFDIDVLDVICEGMTSYHLLDLAKIMQEVASEVIVPSDQIEDFLPFIKRCFPEVIPTWPEGDNPTLGELLPRLHTDITKSLNLAFVLIATGGLLLGGKRPCEDNQPAISMEVEEWESSQAVSEDMETDTMSADPWAGDAESPRLEDVYEDTPEMSTASQDPFSDDPWSGEAESPSLDDKDEIIPQASRPVPRTVERRPKPGHRSPPPSQPDSSKKEVEPPPEPPWKRTIVRPLGKSIFQKEIVRSERSAGKTTRPKVAKPQPARTQSAKLQSPQPKSTRPQSAHDKTDHDLKSRFDKMIEVVRSRDPFEIIGVSIEAQRPEIKKAYFYRHTQFNPDKAYALGQDGQRIVDEIQGALQRALDTLTDPSKRHEYEVRVFADERNKAWSMELRKELAKKQFIRGKWYLSQRLPDLALYFFDSAANLDTDQAPYYAFLGWTQYTTRKADSGESMSFIRTGLGINPRLSEALLFLGWINKDIGEEKKAIEFFEKALDADPNNAFAKQELGKGDKPDKKKPDDGGLFKRFFRK